MKKTKTKKYLKYWIIGLVVFFAFVAVCLWPTKYVIEAPGETDSIGKFIKPQSIKPRPNNFYLVTVSQRPAVLLDYVTSFMRPFDTRYTKEEIMGDASSQEYNQLQKFYMETSQNNALYYAAKKANAPAKYEYLGVYVMSILPSSSFKNKLKVGDNIVAIDNKKFESTKELMNYVNSKRLNTKVKVTVKRNDKLYTYTDKVIKLSGTNRKGIGITLVDHTKVKTVPKININAGDIGGPSAGLMFTLECYQIFAHKTLSKAKIAGTGTIDADGKVGIIGGIDKKVVSANKAGMKVFFAPTDQPKGVKKSDTNYQEAKRTAKKIHSKMKIVPVANFDDALNYLNTHKIK